MLKPIMLELKTYLNQNFETEINYIIGDNFLKYYNEED